MGFVLITASPTLAQQYELVDLGTLGGVFSRANAISENGTIAGWATNAPGVKHAVLWDDTGIVDLGTPAEFPVSEAVDVNDLGQVAGNGEGNPQSLGGYLWDDGVWTPLGTLPGLNESIAEAIDAGGRIVGRSLTLGGGGQSAFIWEDGVMTDLGTLGGSAGAYGVNDLGQVVGWSQAVLPDQSLAPRAFVWQEGEFTNLGVLPGEDFSQAFDINDAGDVVGSSWVVTTPNFFSADRATLWRDGGEGIVDLGLTPGPWRRSSGRTA
jgi:probable HAF family extracellular repeat protein